MPDRGRCEAEPVNVKQTGMRLAQVLPVGLPWFGCPEPLSLREADLMARMMSTSSSLSAGALLATAGAPAAPSLLLSGWACRFRMLANGRRQILGVLLPGDEVNPVLQAQDRLSPYSVVAITTVQVTSADELRQRLLAQNKDFARLYAGCLVNLHLDLSRCFDQAVRLGRQTAYERLSYFLLELYQRLHAIGQVTDNSFHLPLTQEEIGDAVGLSYVHVNRTLQEMRHNKMIAMKKGVITLRDPATLARIAEFSTHIQPNGTGAHVTPSANRWITSRSRAVASPRRIDREVGLTAPAT